MEYFFDMRSRNSGDGKSSHGCLLFVIVCCCIAAVIYYVTKEPDSSLLANMACSSEQELIEDFSANKYGHSGAEVCTSRAIEAAQKRGFFTLAFILKQNRHMRGMGSSGEYLITSAEGDIGWEESSFPGVPLSDRLVGYVMYGLDKVSGFLSFVVIVVAFLGLGFVITASEGENSSSNGHN